MKSWLYVGAKVVALVDATHAGNAPKVQKGQILSVTVINTSPHGNLCIGFAELGPVPATMNIAWPEARGCWHYHAAEFGPVSTIDTSKQIEALRKLVEPSNLPQGVDA